MLKFLKGNMEENSCHLGLGGKISQIILKISNSIMNHKRKKINKLDSITT